MSPVNGESKVHAPTAQALGLPCGCPASCLGSTWVSIRPFQGRALRPTGRQSLTRWDFLPSSSSLLASDKPIVNTRVQMVLVGGGLDLRS